MRRAGPEAHPRAARAKEWASEPFDVTSAGADCWAKRASRVAVVTGGAQEIAGCAQLGTWMKMTSTFENITEKGEGLKKRR